MIEAAWKEVIRDEIAKLQVKSELGVRYDNDRLDACLYALSVWDEERAADVALLAELRKEIDVIEAGILWRVGQRVAGNANGEWRRLADTLINQAVTPDEWANS